MLFMVTLAFIFQSSVSEVEGRIFLMNCPYPTFSALPTIDTIEGTNVIYSMNYSTAHANTVTVFECTVDEMGLFGANTIVYDPAETFFTAFDNAFAWTGYASAYITAFFQKVASMFILAWLFIDAPAQVTGFFFFSVINAIILIWFALGMFIIVRGSS